MPERTPTDSNADLTWRQMAFYAMPAVPLAFLYVPLTALLPAFYATELGLGLTVVGAVLLASRVLDLAMDPTLGRISDTVRTRFGRRKTWMVVSAPVMMGGAAMIFIPPDAAGAWYLFIVTTVIYAGASMLGLSYSAWGAEIVETYHGRARLAGFREVANVLGIVIASAIPAVTALYGHGVDRHTMALLGGAIVVMTPIALWLALSKVPEPGVKVEAHVPWLPSLQSLFRNKPFRFLCGGFVFVHLGTGITNATLIFFVQNYLKQPEVIGPALLVSFSAVLLAVPLWVRISRRIGKHRAAGWSLFVTISINALVTVQLSPGDGWWFVALLGLLGAISAAFLTLPIGIVGDVIDYDTLKSGATRGGLYFGVWSFFQKLAPALAIGAALPFLSSLGFDPSTENSEQSLRALKYVFCFAPVPFYLLGALSLLTFPLDARRHDIVRRRLEQRRARRAPQTGAIEL